MVRKNSLGVVFVVLVCLLMGGAGVQAMVDPHDRLLADVTVALPLESHVKVRWVCPPGDANSIEKAGWSGNHCFAVDVSGQPWLAIPDAGLVLRPTQQVRFCLSHPFTGMTCLSNGALLFVTDHDLGMISAVAQPAVRKGMPILPFQPVLSLPVPGCSEDSRKIQLPAWRASPGSSNCLYVVGNDGDHGQEILLLQPQAGQDDPHQVLRSFRRIFVSARPILAVAGDGQTTYASLGRAVVRIGAGQPDTKLWVHPTHTVRELAYSPDAGLFYATQDAVGVITDTGGWEFLRCPRAHLALQGGSLYVFLPHTMAVFALDQVADLAKVRPVAPAPSSPSVEVTDIEFYANKRADPNGQPLPGDVFESQEISYVRGEVHLRPLPKQDHPTLLSIQWRDLRTGKTRSEGLTVDLSDGKDQSRSFKCSVGWRETGRFYPGRYAMTVFIGGVEARTASFQVRGTPTLMEAVASDDPATVKNLLEQGGNPNERDRDPQYNHGTALARAVPIDVRIVQLLLEHGAEVNAKDDYGRTPLLCVPLCRDPAEAHQIAAALIQYGADVNAVDGNGVPVLCTIVHKGSFDLVDLLLQHGANPNQPVKREDGVQFQIQIVLYGSYRTPQTASILELLLDHGANPNSRQLPPVGMCAMDLAVGDPEPQYVQILLRHGALLDPPPSGRTESQLHKVLQTWLDAPTWARPTWARGRAQKAKDVFFILRAHGARLRPQEEPIVADKRLHGWLPRDFILDVFKRNDQAVLDARDLADPLLQGMVISRLLDMARAKTVAATSKEGYQAALALCDQAKTRAQVWKIESQCPLIYYNTGLLYGQLGEIEAAKDNFRRYLALAPNAQDADAIRKSVGL